MSWGCRIEHMDVREEYECTGIPKWRSKSSASPASALATSSIGPSKADRPPRPTSEEKWEAFRGRERETIPKGRKSEVTKRVEMVGFDIQITFGALPKIIDVELSGGCDRKHIVSGESTKTGKGRFGADERNAIKKRVPAIERRRFSHGRRCHWKLPVHTPSAQTLRRRSCYVHFLYQ